MKKVEPLMIHSVHSSIPIQSQSNNVDQFGKMETVSNQQNYPISQSFHLQPVQNYTNEYVSSAQYLNPQTNRSISGKYMQSPS